MNSSDFRRFCRRLRASNMYKFRKTGCDMGWYGHFVQPERTPEIDEVLKKILNDMKKRCKDGHLRNRNSTIRHNRKGS